MNKDERLRRAERASVLLADPLLTEAFEHIEAECWRKFRELAPTDTDGLSQVKAMQYMHQKYRAFLQSAVTDGKMVKLELEEKRPRPAGY